MRWRVLLGVCLGAGVLGAYTLGVHRARGDAIACYQKENERPGCSSCVSSPDCPPCDDGTCPGDVKICQQKFDLLIVIETSGWLNASPVGRACFYLQSCAPHQQGACSAENPCVPKGDPEYSRSFFTTHILTGECPPP